MKKKILAEIDRRMNGAKSIIIDEYRKPPVYRRPITILEQEAQISELRQLRKFITKLK